MFLSSSANSRNRLSSNAATTPMSCKSMHDRKICLIDKVIRRTGMKIELPSENIVPMLNMTPK